MPTLSTVLTLAIVWMAVALVTGLALGPVLGRNSSHYPPYEG